MDLEQHRSSTDCGKFGLQMFTDIKASPSKGKAREESRWQFGWWDFYPLGEENRRPVVWTRSSTIFTAHPTQPLIIATIFSSSKQFHIPPPQPIFQNPVDYEPPTIITVPPTEDWLFAFYPGRQGDGIACLWRRNNQVDNWMVKEWWSFARGAGVVAAEWLSSEREWVTTEEDVLYRRPPRGPSTPVSDPTLLLVTQTHQLNVCYLRTYIPTLKVLSCSLIQPTTIIENQTNPIYDFANGPGGFTYCVNATIGLGYNESSILIAMRSALLPSPSTHSTTFDDMDLSISLDMSQPSSSEPILTNDRESWGEESTIELCEVELGFDGILMSLSSRPLPSIRYPAACLTDLSFLWTPPGPSNKTAHIEPSNAPVNGSGQCYLAATFLDFKNYDVPPKSELVLYSFSRPSHASRKLDWTPHLVSSRLFSTNVLAFCRPYIPSSDKMPFGLYVGILETGGTLYRSKKRLKQAYIGYIAMLKLSDLSDDERWERSPIIVSPQNATSSLPLSSTVSPNHELLCTVSSSLLGKQASIHPLPEYSLGKAVPVLESFSYTIASAIRSRKPTSDITYLLPRTVSIDHIEDILCEASRLLDSLPNGLPNLWKWELLGVVVEVYRSKAQRADSTSERQQVTRRWRTAHDMCTLIACNTGFKDCQEGSAFDLEAVWQLAGLSTWIIDFIEELIKECLLLGTSLNTVPPSGVKNEDDSDSQTTLLETHALFHLAHPFALVHLHEALGHVKRFYTQLNGASARGENAQIAKDTLVDLVNHSGVDLGALQTFLAEFIEEASNIPATESRRSLVLCQPVQSMEPFIHKVIERLATSSIIDKPRLFVKPFDLVDGMTRVPLVEQQNKGAERDVIFKTLLTRHRPGIVCIRCSGKSEIDNDVNIASHISLRWRAWERMWSTRCACGGAWTIQTVYSN